MASLSSDEGGQAEPVREVASYLRQLTEVAASAGGQTEVMAQAAALVEAQRVSAWGLRAAVTLARAQGLSWRDLAELLGVPPATLHRQYQAGRGLTAAAHDAPDEPVERAAPAPGRLPGDLPPVGLDLFVGRDREVADLPAVLSRRRLMTLTGAAGVGKTRLAVELAHRATSAYRGGTWWVELAPVSHPAQVTAAVTACVSATNHSSDDIGTLDELLHEASHLGPMLLVLDNCEHVVGTAADLAAHLLAEHPQLRILATSRESLRAPGETVVTVHPLTLADPIDPAVRQADAVRLFTDRARASAHDFDLAEHAATVAEICNQLDGVPLAIELAAQQTGVLPPESILARLSDRLDLLTGGPRTAPRRQQSMRAAIDWSYALLDPAEQAVFRRLTILPGGFDQLTAAAVTADLQDQTTLWPLLTGLAGKSLLATDPGNPGRLRVLLSLRAYGSELLAAAGELPIAQDLLIRWFTELAREQSNVVFGSNASDLAARIMAEHDNLRYAVEVAERTGDPRYPVLANLLALAWGWRGELRQAQALLRHLLTRHDPGPTERADALRRLSTMLAEPGGDYPAAVRYAAEGLALARELGSRTLVLRALAASTYVHQAAGDTAAAIAFNREQIDVLRPLDMPRELAYGLGTLAWALLISDEEAAAEEAVAEALTLLGSDLDPNVLHTAGASALVRGELEVAADHFSTALAISPPELKEAILYALEGLALVAAAQHDADRALRLLTAAASARAALGLEETFAWWTRQLDEADALARKTASEPVAPRPLSVEEAVDYALYGRLPGAGLPISPLTSREERVAELVAEGHTNQQIAARMSISVRTVASHLTNIRSRLDLPTRAHIAAWVVERRNSRE